MPQLFYSISKDIITLFAIQSQAVARFTCEWELFCKLQPAKLYPTRGKICEDPFSEKFTIPSLRKVSSIDLENESFKVLKEYVSTLGVDLEKVLFYTSYESSLEGLHERKVSHIRSTNLGDFMQSEPTETINADVIKRMCEGPSFTLKEIRGLEGDALKEYIESKFDRQDLE